jgi:hypothetical protein
MSKSVKPVAALIEDGFQSAYAECYRHGKKVYRSMTFNPDHAARLLEGESWRWCDGCTMEQAPTEAVLRAAGSLL